MIAWLFSPQVECKNLKHLLREICDRETTSSVHEEENTELLRLDSDAEKVWRKVEAELYFFRSFYRPH